jgi:hypothetical protein
MALEYQHKEVAKILAKAGIKSTIEHGGKHIRVLFKLDGRDHVIHCCKSPSDYRAMANARSYVHRLLKKRAVQPA